MKYVAIAVLCAVLSALFILDTKPSSPVSESPKPSDDATLRSLKID